MKQHCLSTHSISRGMLTALRASAQQNCNPPHGTPEAARKTVALLFFEPSTRTHASFELACQRAGMHCLSLPMHNASTQKGESDLDTLRTIAAMGVDAIVVRHRDNGFMDQAKAAVGDQCSLINAGCGSQDHPTQALLDIDTLLSIFPSQLATISVVGDIVHARVAAALATILRLTPHLTLQWVAPPCWQPKKSADSGIRRFTSLDEALPSSDVLYMLRMQKERFAQDDASLESFEPSDFCLNEARLAQAPAHAKVMHPGPINRGVELSSAVADGPSSLIGVQVARGVAMRAALLHHLLH